MDLRDTADEAAFRATVRGWLDANAELRSPGDKSASMFSDRLSDADIAAAKAWQARKADAGWAGITWPREYGGRDGTPIEQVIWNQEEARYRVPPDLFEIGIAVAGPVLLTHGTAEQKARFLPPMLRGDEIWCQFFSEPGAGSDLAGVSTSATRIDDGWVINGQKIWVSGAQYCMWGTMVARTDPSVPKHRGLTEFIVDVEAEGVDVRPIKQLTGGSHFNEVFFTDVRIPDTWRLGDVGDGWRVAMTTLMNERADQGAQADETASAFDDLLALAERTGAAGDPAVRQQLASYLVRVESIRYMGYRLLSAISSGAVPGPEGSILKLLQPRLNQEMAAFALELLGPPGYLDADEWDNLYLSSSAMRVAGGTDEIQRNIISERVLGLPPEIRVDKDVPFRDVPRGAR